MLDLFDAYRTVSERRLVECYHDALTAREQVLQMFNLGLLSLEFRGLAERLYWATCAKIRDVCRKLERLPEELEDLESILSDTYFCNFSVFQSLPDSWAIDQLFPIMPIHRLDERPTRTGVLADITCDSDGKIDHFVSLRDVKRTLELHELKPGESYYLAVFLVGAYQETLGDLHNLFGDTHVVHVRLHDEGGWWIEEIVKGDTANKVLEYMEYDVAELYPALARDCERAIRDGRMTLAESQALKRFYESELEATRTWSRPAPRVTLTRATRAKVGLRASGPRLALVRRAHSSPVCPMSASAPSTKKATAARPFTSLIGTRFAAAPPRNTTGTLASSMPSVVPHTTGRSCWYLAASATVASWVLSPIRQKERDQGGTRRRTATAWPPLAAPCPE